MSDLPVADREARLSAGPIRYRELGTGQPLVFVHGLLVNGLLWKDLVAELESDFRCIVPDWPLGSHAAAMDPDAELSPPAVARLVAELIETLELEAVTLVGNDTGGAICQLVAIHGPPRIARLVLTNSDAYENFPPRMFRYLNLLARLPGGMTAMAQALRLKSGRRAPIAYGALTRRRLDDALLEAWARPSISDAAIRHDLGRFIRGMSPRQTMEAARRLSDFRAPTLLAWAPEDRFFPIEHAERLAAAIPDARLERIAASKAFIPLDQPQRLAAVLGDFIRQTSPSSGS